MCRFSLEALVVQLWVIVLVVVWVDLVKDSCTAYNYTLSEFTKSQTCKILEKMMNDIVNIHILDG